MTLDQHHAKREEGQAAIENAAVLAVAAAIVAILLSTQAGIMGSATELARRVICLIVDQTCVGATPLPTADSAARIDALVRGEAARAPFVAREGGRVAGLAAEAKEARRRGDLDAAEVLGRMLDLYRAVAGDTSRGRLLGGLTTPTEAEFRRLVNQGSIKDGDGGSRRYFDVDARPGDGIVVMDFFIRQKSSGLVLDGDGRDFVDPLRSRRSTEDSRVIVVVDRESGRGTVYLSQTCTVDVLGKSYCNEARPIALDLDDRLVNDPANDVTGEGVNIDMTNRIEIDSDDDEMEFRFDMLNSILPVFSVDGSFSLVRGRDGRYDIKRINRDRYPALGVYQYQGADGEIRTVYEDRGGDVRKAVPHCDMPNLPKLPFGPDLPNLPSVPGPCF